MQIVGDAATNFFWCQQASRQTARNNHNLDFYISHKQNVDLCFNPYLNINGSHLQWVHLIIFDLTKCSKKPCDVTYFYALQVQVSGFWWKVLATLVYSGSFACSGEMNEISPYETLPYVSLKLLRTSWFSHNKCMGIPAPLCAFGRAPSDGKNIWTWTRTQYIGKYCLVSWS